MTTPWRIVLADGRVLEVQVLQARGNRLEASVDLDAEGPYLWWTRILPGEEPHGGEMELAVVTGLACTLADARHLVAAILAPGQPTPAEAIAQEREHRIVAVEALRPRCKALPDGESIVDQIISVLRSSTQGGVAPGCKSGAQGC